MNKKAKQRFIIAGGIVVLVVIVLLAVVGSQTAAQSMSVTQAAQNSNTTKRVEVSGKVVSDSYAITDDILTFSLYDPDNPSSTIAVRYDKGIAATFGNEVTAICTGTIDEEGVLQCSELVTKCPSKYESSTDALSVVKLLDYGSSIYEKPVKLVGTVSPGTLTDLTEDVRFYLCDVDDATIELPVMYSGALPDDVTDGARLVLTGSLNSDGAYHATDVALED